MNSCEFQIIEGNVLSMVALGRWMSRNKDILHLGSKECT